MRRRYRYDEETKTLVEVSLDAPVTPRVELQTGAHYEGARATDGTPIDTPAKHREYMKRHNLCLAADMQQTWAEAPAKKAQEAARGRRDAIGRAIYQLEKRGRRGRN